MTTDNQSYFSHDIAEMHYTHSRLTSYSKAEACFISSRPRSNFFASFSF